MGIGSIKGIENISGRPIGSAQPVDSASKNIQKEISEVQRQKQNLSSKNDLPAAEKEKERQKLQQKMSGLNRELRQRQAQNRKEQQREALTDESRTDIFGTKDAKDKNIKASNATAKDDTVKDKEINSTKATEAGRTDIQNNKTHNMACRADDPKKNADDKTAQDKVSGNKDTQDKASTLQDFEIPQKEWKAVAMSDSSKEQMRKQEAVIARIEGGIAILKSEIRLDEARGEDVTKKQAELDKQEAKLQQTSAASSSLGQLNQAAERTASAKPGEATNFSKEKEPAEQQPLFKDITVSLMN